MAAPSRMIHAALVRINNRLTRWRRVKTTPDRLLLLAARCLQGLGCPQDLSAGAGACAGCGRCPVQALAALERRYGVRCRVAAGGRQALALAKEKRIDAVIAIACEKELIEGILALFPKPVLAVSNSRPNGECRATQVDLALVEAAIRELLAEPDPQPDRQKG